MNNTKNGAPGGRGTPRESLLELLPHLPGRSLREVLCVEETLIFAQTAEVVTDNHRRKGQRTGNK